MAFNSIKDILAKIRARNPSLEKRIDEAQAVAAWEKTVGTQIANHARALKVENGVLWIEVDHAVWRTELHHRKRQLLDRLNQASGTAEPVIRDLFLIDPRRTYGATDSPRDARDSKYMKKNKRD